MAEVRNLREGTLRWVAASGSGSAWATASAPASGLFGYVRSWDHTSAATFVQVMERGTPDHNKLVSLTPPALNVVFDWTGLAPTAVSGSGASVPMFHLEHKATSPEQPAHTGYYHQFYGAVIPSYQNTEADEADTMTLQITCLAMNGPTASGYLS